jgi:hypothetical protein
LPEYRVFSPAGSQLPSGISLQRQELQIKIGEAITMSFRISGSTRVSIAPRTEQKPRGVALLGGTILLVGVVWLLWVQRGFAEYALTGIFWDEAQGTVVDATHRSRNTSKPIVEFSTPDGAMHAFTEDYVRLCGGRRSFCFIRSFEPGEQVPVVYNPREPAQAYIHDWALFATVLTVFLEACAAALLALMLVALVRRRAIKATVRLGGVNE